MHVAPMELSIGESLQELCIDSPTYVVGVCAMECKSRSKPMRNILNALMATGPFTVEIFNEKMILEEDVSDWPLCNFLISFYSTGFPLDKAINYAALRRPYVLNDLQFQTLLFDRRLVLSVLTNIGVPTLKRVVLNRDPPKHYSSAIERLARRTGGNLATLWAPSVSHRMVGRDILVVDGIEIEKPFVEKPTNAEDHNVYVYYHSFQGGGCRKLFRKIDNKSSQFFPDIWDIRTDGSYIYEKYVNVDHLEDVKVYTIGEGYAYAETRKSPVIDGIVQRNHEGKELRFETVLSQAEKEYSRLIANNFRQAVCGFDVLRTEGRSYVIDVNGWSFVKGNSKYYQQCAEILAEMFLKTAHRSARKSLRPPSAQLAVPNGAEQWRLKGFFCVLRHADRTPKLKQKFVVGLSSPFFRDLLGDSRVETVCKTPGQLAAVIAAARQTIAAGTDDERSLHETRRLLDLLLERGEANSTAQKVQIKASWSKSQPGVLTKIQVVVKWGGGFTHAGAHQAVDLAENMRKDLVLLNRTLLEDVRVYTASEDRVLATANAFLNTFLAVSPPGTLAKGHVTSSEQLPHIRIRPDLLDDAYAAKEPMELVKVALMESSSNIETIVIQEDHRRGKSASVFSVLPHARQVLDEIGTDVSRLKSSLERNYSENASRYDKIQAEWCCGESPAMFYERWTRLLSTYSTPGADPAVIDMSKVPEAYDSLKYDLLHNRPFLTAMFNENDQDSPTTHQQRVEQRRGNAKPVPMRVRRFYFNTKTLFDIVAPGEYGTTCQEKLNIGISTCHALLDQLISEISEVGQGGNAQTRFYFTKERHIQTLLNMVYQSGLSMRVSRDDLGELDYLSQIAFEIYERKKSTTLGEREFSFRVSLSPGARNTQLPDLDVEQHHALSALPRRALTHHQKLGEAISQLKSLSKC